MAHISSLEVGSVAHNRSPSMMMVGWQFKSESDWKNFTPQTSAIIEEARSKNKDEVKFKAFGKTYILNFERSDVRIQGLRDKYPARKFKGSTNVSCEAIKIALESLNDDEEPDRVENFIPPHHLVYKNESTTGYLCPVLAPQANIGIAGRLVVTAIRGRNLFNSQAIGSQDPYIRFSVEGTSKIKKLVYPIPRCKDGGQNPVWNHTVEIPISSEDKLVRVSVWNKNTLADSLIGRTRLPLHSILPFINPIVAFYHQKENEHAKTKIDSYEDLFLCTDKYALECAKYSLRSWFELLRDLKSTTSAGQVLLDFRFFPYRASKIIDWDNEDDAKKGGEIRRAQKIFGESLETGRMSSEVKFPQPIFDCVEFLYRQGLKHEGLFRIPGDNKKIEGMKKDYDMRKMPVLKGINEVAGLLKLYFRELASPLIPYKLFKHFISVPGEAKNTEDLIEKYKVVISMMDETTRNTLHYLFAFLAEVSSHSDVNKMLPNNIAVCWAPTLMRAENPNDPNGIMNIPKTISATQNLVVHFKAIFGGGGNTRGSVFAGMKNQTKQPDASIMRSPVAMRLACTEDGKHIRHHRQLSPMFKELKQKSIKINLKAAPKTSAATHKKSPKSPREREKQATSIARGRGRAPGAASSHTSTSSVNSCLTKGSLLDSITDAKAGLRHTPKSTPSRRNSNSDSVKTPPPIPVNVRSPTGGPGSGSARSRSRSPSSCRVPAFGAGRTPPSTSGEPRHQKKWSTATAGTVGSRRSSVGPPPFTKGKKHVPPPPPRRTKSIERVEKE
mmetsp:Transcript_16648/g.29857  ORF Transcript_16648/g.29857 Transcript_16648/m.29857 type:complete len:782 (+) Transcript_16648:265-2610(+)